MTLDHFPLTLQEYTSNDGETKYTGYGLYFGATEEATWGVKLKMTWLNGIDFVRIVRYSLQEIIRGNAGMSDLNGPVGIVSTINDVGAAERHSGGRPGQHCLLWSHDCHESGGW